ncbi:hypothetical protein FPQ18DRAFT_393436 [Pyronema domesticum]|uniref:DUF2470 domain-containing protein n=1 Tax=Pyronema omphalodes (strain CBS 100304) TaxID=1076935 RepID=U4LU99_PYROM|nr:hypothetical protein FPQ18DRAFT_393436 [Pyronema domesticum]CCX33515.1 Similar to hypothetical protein [Tuber melanosporum Mel28]; acc. no. XP_002835413 [Pyronema omphalodes CBS 100304]
MAAPLDATAVSRVIDHINKNHAEAVDDWAQYYARLPASLAKTATLSTFTLEKLTLSVTSPHGAKSTVNIPLNPPMKSVNDCRERMAYMAIEAMEGLGRSRYQVKRWVPPGFVGSIVCAAVSFGYWAFFNGATQFARGGWVRENILRGEAIAPTAELMREYHMQIFFLIFAIHIAEGVWIHRSRLGKHGVKTGSVLWWKWALSTFWEGFGSVVRFDGEVRRLKEEEAAKQGKIH